MELPEQRRNALIGALHRGVLARLLKSHKYAIQLAPGRHGYNVTLVDGNGATPEGQFVYEQLGLAIPIDLSFDQFAQPYRRGANEYVKRLDGQGQNSTTRAQWTMGVHSSRTTMGASGKGRSQCESPLLDPWRQ